MTLEIDTIEESVEENQIGYGLTSDMVSKGLKTLGMHPLVQKHTFLELFLANLQLMDIDILRNYPLVMYLDISDNCIRSLAPLEKMTALIQLKARNNKIKECLQYFPPLCNDRSSWLGGHSAVGSMLTLVDLSENLIEKMQPLSNHPYLECLLLARNRIQKIEGLRGLRFLQTLDLSHNEIKAIDNLADLPIRELNLSHNQISSLNGISLMKYLTAVNLSHNQFYSLAAMQSCVNLTYIDLSYNQIQYIRQVELLTDIPWLQVLILKGNPCAYKPHYRLRVIYRLLNLQRLDDIAISAEEKIRAHNLYHSSGGDLGDRKLIHEQISPNVPFIDFTPQQLEDDEELGLSNEELHRNVNHDAMGSLSNQNHDNETDNHNDNHNDNNSNSNENNTATNKEM